MASRQKELTKILIDNKFSVQYPFIIDREDLFYNSPYHDLITDVYKSLGGILAVYPVNFGDFDIMLDHCFIELDEEHHFNRYRNITLDAPLYKNSILVQVELYKFYCAEYENKVGKTGNFWSTTTSDIQFGKSQLDYGFSGNGPSRWKQRAFYDFLRDVFSLLQPKPVFRISTYENIGCGKTSINTILKKGRNKELLTEYLKKRIRQI